jgi:crotonobetainyl-CoA:carnitine CoA-transferase CaiB-like acyl-CoA transferase
VQLWFHESGFGEVNQANIGRILSPRVPLAFSRNTTLLPSASPRLGQDTASVLQELLGLSPGEIRPFSGTRYSGLSCAWLRLNT